MPEVTSRDQAELFDRLVILARGDEALVRQAIREAARGSERADLAEVMRIVEERRQ